MPVPWSVTNKSLSTADDQTWFCISVLGRVVDQLSTYVMSLKEDTPHLSTSLAADVPLCIEVPTENLFLYRGSKVG